MELLNLQFAILVIKLGLCAILGFFGLALLIRNEESKRAWRDSVCRFLFGFNNAVPYKKFARVLTVLGLLLLLTCGTATWFLLLRNFI
jgi:hypothetical protein